MQKFNRIVKIDDLGRLIKEKRMAESLTLAAAAKQSGVSAPTLSRLERQYKDGHKAMVPDTNTLTALTQWLGVSVEQMLTIHQSEPMQEDTPEIVKAHLRADRNLNPEAAEALGEMFRLAYDQFSKASLKPAKNSDDESV